MAFRRVRRLCSLIVVLPCVYGSAQIFLFGAEFTWVYHTATTRAGRSRRDAAAQERR